jgi:hypothetical protein
MGRSAAARVAAKEGERGEGGEGRAKQLGSMYVGIRHPWLGMSRIERAQQTPRQLAVTLASWQLLACKDWRGRERQRWMVRQAEEGRWV